MQSTKHLFIFSLVISIVIADWYHNTKAFEINNENYDNIVGSDKNIILDFFTPWCIYCQYMANDWNKVWEHYNGANSQRSDIILIAKINCGEDRNHHICHSYGVHSFPTILHIGPQSKESKNHFHGNRSYQDFVDWIERIIPQSKEETQRAELLRIDRERKNQEEQERLQQQQVLEEQERERIKMEEQKQQEIQQKEFDIIDTNKKIEERMQEMKLQLEEFENQKTFIQELSQQLEVLEKKFTEYENQQFVKGVNWQHASIFIIFGAFLGMVVLSFMPKGNQNTLIDVDHNSSHK